MQGTNSNVPTPEEAIKIIRITKTINSNPDLPILPVLTLTMFRRSLKLKHNRSSSHHANNRGRNSLSRRFSLRINLIPTEKKGTFQPRLLSGIIKILNPINPDPNRINQGRILIILTTSENPKEAR
jgi:hypothetical protein